MIDIRNVVRYFTVTLGMTPVKRAGRTLLLLLLGTVAWAAVVPPANIPETSYNEADTPVNLARPVVPGIRLARPGAGPVILPAQLRLARPEPKPVAKEVTFDLAPTSHSSHSLQDLLCILIL